MNEFELIEQLIQEFGDLTEAEFIDTGAGDDAAVALGAKRSPTRG